MSNKEKQNDEINPVVPFQNRYYVKLIHIFLFTYGIILIGTLILPFFLEYLRIESDPAFIYFPYIAYIPNTITIVVLLYAMKIFYQIQVGEIDERIENKYLNSLISSFEHEENISGLSNIIRRVSLLLAFLITSFTWLLGVTTIPSGGESLLLSPINMLSLPFGLSGLMIYIAFGINHNHHEIIKYLLLIFLLNIILHVIAIILAGDYLVLPLSLSYQVSALLLILVRWLNLI